MDQAKILKTIGHPTRIRLLALLLAHELCVCELEEILNIRQANISKHLFKLKSEGLVLVRREKQRAFYFVSDRFKQERLLNEYIQSIVEEDALLQEDYARFIAHEKVKDQNVYVCNIFKEEKA